jgi:phospholipid/cholesterol/gamma-HCH transport system permease protein
MAKGLNDFFYEAGETANFGWRFLKEAWFPPYEFKETVRQCYEIGYKSLNLVCITAFIIGLVFTLQSRPTLVEFGAESWLPYMVGLSIIR